MRTTIKNNIAALKQEIPSSIKIVLACKTRSAEEIESAIDAGITDIGQNYVQEAETMRQALGEKARKVRWHMIGHVQKNKINKILSLFDVIQTVDSFKCASEINKRAQVMEKVMPVYLEINIADEPNKAGIKPDISVIEALIHDMSKLPFLKLEGLMTMGPLTDDSQAIRPYFKKMNAIFNDVKRISYPNVDIRELSMGMSDSYLTAIEEGATIIRPGTIIFGKRQYT
ncbi:YggS family pyridoxal phosphate-dependent enzyme [Thermoproteota archaeon]